MFSLSVQKIAGAISGEILAAGSGTGFCSVCTDSRAVKPGDLFFALRGERFDGHEFAVRALESGAAGVVLERPVDGVPAGSAVIRVEDTTRALQDLAAFNRVMSGVPLVGVTGSSGKTTTKDLIHCVLSARFNTLKTEGNFNNELGVPLTLLRVDGEHQAAVVEMAMRGAGEIDFLSRLARPTGAVITNIGEAHFELLGSVDNIARAKGEILDHITEQGFAVLHGDSPYMEREARRCRGRVVLYGEDPGWDVFVREAQPVDGGSRFIAVIRGVEEEFFVPLPGRHNVINSLAAVAVGMEMGMAAGEIRAGLSGARLTGMRLEITVLGGIKIINDSYNANPSSTAAAVQALAEVAGGESRTIAVLGDMLELGEKSGPGHREVGRQVWGAGIDILVAVGDLAAGIGQGAREAGMPAESIHYFGSAREAALGFVNRVRKGDVILVKGSRGMRMEEFIRALKEVLG
ncbi:MAG: UDP-N-acetylmuramoyl-tripeptide--D-alanyl-D-alanine ligase [Bacillota bacterium]